MAKRSAYKEMQGLKKTALKFIKQKKPVKYALYRARWRLAPKLQYVTNFPTHVDIESTSTCNFKCVMCPHNDPTPEFKDSLGFMKFDMFQRIIDEGTKKGLRSIKLNWRGEPLMSKLVPKMVKYAKEKGIIETLINTNAQLLTEKTAKELIKADLDVLIVSFDAFTKKNYELIRLGGNYDIVKGNVEKFIELRNSMGKKKPLVRMQFVKMDINQNEIEDFVNYWNPKVDMISIQDYTLRQPGLKYGEDKLLEKEVSIGRLPCPQIWQRMIITWDGKAIMCCRDWESTSVIGDFNKNSIEEIWKGKILTKIREIHKKKELNKIPVCNKCTYKETHDWVKSK